MIKIIFNISDTQFINEHTILDNNEMEGLAEIKKQEEDSDQMYRKGMPVLDSTHNGVCYCAVGECDCDGSIWN